MAVDTRGFQLTPQVGGNILPAAQALQGLQQRDQEFQSREQLKQLLGQGDIEGARQLDPIVVQKFQQNKNALAKQEFDQATREDQQDLANHVNRVAKLKAMAPEQRVAFMQQEITQGEQAGLDLTESRNVLDTLVNNSDQAEDVINKGIELGQITGTLKELRTDVAKAGVMGLDEVKSSKINEDGSATIVTKGGELKVLSPDDLEREIIKNANAEGINIQQKRAQARGKGKAAAKTGTEAIKQASTLRGNNALLKQVIDEVRDGAETGPLADKLPSFRAETVRLNQLKNKLGLDVVGSVTFGALSEGELKLALNTALPTNLDGPELVEWADNKIEAQEKLAAYLEEQAIFLDKSGNTPAMWLEQQKQKSQAQPDQTQDDLTPEEQAELAALEAEFGK